MSDIGERIYKRRKELKMTQRELAEMIDVSDKTISRWETGTTIPDALQIPLIACALKLKPNDLFDEGEAERFLAQRERERGKDDKRPFVISVFVSSALALLSAAMFVLMVTVDAENVGFLVAGIVLAIASICVYAASEVIFSRSYLGKFRKNEEERVDFLYSVIYFLLVAFLSSLVLSVATFETLENELLNALLSAGDFLLFAGLAFAFIKIKHQRIGHNKFLVSLFFLSAGMFVAFLVLAFLGHPALIKVSIVGITLDIALMGTATLTSTKA